MPLLAGRAPAVLNEKTRRRSGSFDGEQGVAFSCETVRALLLGTRVLPNERAGASVPSLLLSPAADEPTSQLGAANRMFTETRPNRVDPRPSDLQLGRRVAWKERQLYSPCKWHNM